MAVSVWFPDAAFVPDHPPLAVQLVATGLVDQVSLGVTLPVPLLGLAVNVTVPAVCACAAPANIPMRAQPQPMYFVFISAPEGLRNSSRYFRAAARLRVTSCRLCGARMLCGVGDTSRAGRLLTTSRTRFKGRGAAPVAS
jgi:hypothetical protein